MTLYHGDCRDVLGHLHGDLIITDPPYEQTSLHWDRWPAGWLDAAGCAPAMWCFLPLRQFAMPPYRGREFTAAGWRLSQDLEPALDTDHDHVTWEKHNGSGFAADRFRRVHETVTHWYRGRWAQVHHEVPAVAGTARPSARIAHRNPPTHTSHIGSAGYTYGPTRLARTVVRVRSLHGSAIHPTQKPIELLDLLIRYGCPEGATVIDPFAGSGSTGIAARAAGRRAVLIEADERHCERAARWLAATRRTAFARPARTPSRRAVARAGGVAVPAYLLQKAPIDDVDRKDRPGRGRPRAAAPAASPAGDAVPLRRLRSSRRATLRRPVLLRQPHRRARRLTPSDKQPPLETWRPAAAVPNWIQPTQRAGPAGHRTGARRGPNRPAQTACGGRRSIGAASWVADVR